MLAFVVRRLGSSLAALLAATYVVYVLTCFAGDPTADLQGIPDSSAKALQIAQRTELLHLDVTPFLRYFIWLRGIGGFLLPGVDGSFGTNRYGQDVGVLLGHALGSTLRLVTTAALTAVVLGVLVGVISALRHYSRLDFTITIGTLVLFCLPAFWVAVLLKQFGAIAVNRWLADPQIPVGVTIAVAVLVALGSQALAGGGHQRRLVSAVTAAATTAGALQYLSAVRWFANPALGPAMIAVGAAVAALAATAVTAGLHRRTVLRTSLIVALLGVCAYPLTRPLLRDPTWLVVLGLLALTVTICVAAGHLLGGVDRFEATWAALITGVATAALIFADHVLRAVPSYSQLVGGTVIATVGSRTPTLDGDFWQRFLDAQAHLLLPTLTLVLVSFATYARYTRSSLLEVMATDYVQAARAKGLPERDVVLRHALRNSLLPVVSLIAVDIAAFCGGAVVAEAVFGWSGMGTMFITGVHDVNPDPVMAFFLVTAAVVVLCNLAADISYAYLDPRITLR